jgi:glutamate-ammonia-ligase adenylyltransferase
MKKVWLQAIQSSADPSRAKHFFDLLAATPAGTTFIASASSHQARIVTTLMGASQALGSLSVARPDWLRVVEPQSLEYPRRKQGFSSEVKQWLKALLEKKDYTAALARLREFKQRETLRIAARDLMRLANVPEITRELSALADVCLETVWQVSQLQLSGKYGLPWHQDLEGRWQPTASCLLGLGKLGGEELNYSSDVDVILVYTEEGSVFIEPPQSGQPQASADSSHTRSRRSKAVVAKKSNAQAASRPTLTNHEYFNRLAKAVIAELTRMTQEGTLYRIDFRLRPEGDAGPLSRSLAGYENYYAQWGQTWERMMLIKARVVAGDGVLAAEFLEMVQPFRYPRSVNQSVLQEVAAMKDRIENEVVKAGELERNVKLGLGGIREVEFIVQSLQLLHAGRQPFLQGTQTLPLLEKLVQYAQLSADDTRALSAAYCFLRDVEHRLQMEANLQTHTIPSDRPARERLARLMGLNSAQEFEAQRKGHTQEVRRVFDKILKPELPVVEAAPRFPSEFDGAETRWKRILAEHGFKDVDKAVRVLREFVEGPGYVHVSPRTKDLAYRLLPKLFSLCLHPQTPAVTVVSGAKKAEQATLPLSDPDRVVTRLDNFISAYGARSTLFELWHRNPTIFELLVCLFDRSEFMAELAIRTPDLVDELVTSGRLRQRKTAQETLRDLQHGHGDEDQHFWLRRYHQAELMRIGLRDMLGLVDFEQYLVELSVLADACLQHALEVVTRRHKMKLPPFAVIGLGKLGGAEIDYGSDLDIVFVADSKVKSVAERVRIAVDLMDLLSRRTEQGVVFHTDARLRPDGEKGLLVNTLDAFERYYRQRAQLWEIQSLTRARQVAGDAKTGGHFLQLAGELTNFEKPSSPLAAYSPDWKAKIHQMRMRIEKERTRPGQDALAIKTGKGGLIDAEFIAQALCLQHGWREPNTVRALEKGRYTKTLPDAEKLILNYRKLRKVEGILRRWSYEGETVLPDEPAPYLRVSLRCGFKTSEEFRAALVACRKAIRDVYSKVFRP